ncbi:hypothetical protein [Rhodococcus pyridinivorans]
MALTWPFRIDGSCAEGFRTSVVCAEDPNASAICGSKHKISPSSNATDPTHTNHRPHPIEANTSPDSANIALPLNKSVNPTSVHKAPARSATISGTEEFHDARTSKPVPAIPAAMRVSFPSELSVPLKVAEASGFCSIPHGPRLPTITAMLAIPATTYAGVFNVDIAVAGDADSVM